MSPLQVREETYLAVLRLSRYLSLDGLDVVSGRSAHQETLHNDLVTTKKQAALQQNVA